MATTATKLTGEKIDSIFDKGYCIIENGILIPKGIDKKKGHFAIDEDDGLLWLIGHDHKSVAEYEKYGKKLSDLEVTISDNKNMKMLQNKQEVKDWFLAEYGVEL